MFLKLNKKFLILKEIPEFEQAKWVSLEQKIIYYEYYKAGEGGYALGIPTTPETVLSVHKITGGLRWKGDNMIRKLEVEKVELEDCPEWVCNIYNKALSIDNEVYRIRRMVNR